MIDVKCPYCGHNNCVACVKNDVRVVICSPLGPVQRGKRVGCLRKFVVEIKMVPDVTVYRMEEIKNEHA